MNLAGELYEMTMEGVAVVVEWEEGERATGLPAGPYEEALEWFVDVIDVRPVDPFDPVAREILDAIGTTRAARMGREAVEEDLSC